MLNHLYHVAHIHLQNTHLLYFASGFASPLVFRSQLSPVEVEEKRVDEKSERLFWDDAHVQGSSDLTFSSKFFNETLILLF